jgi:hypothetical protein
MRLLVSGRVGRVLLGLVVAAGVFGVATAVEASIPDAAGVIHGCYDNKGALRVIDSASSTCKASETGLNWSQTGPKGQTGLTGATGSTGAAGTARDVGSVDATATPGFYSSDLKGWVAVSTPSIGKFCLTPDPGVDISNGLVVSLGSPGGSAPNGFVSWNGYCSTNPLEFEVDTVNTADQFTYGINFTAIVP